MRLGLVLLLLLGNIFVLERFFSQQNFSLFDLRNDFLVGKRTMKMSLMGCDFFLMGRAAVAQGEAHLHRWFGHQEIRTTRPHTLKEISLKAALHDKGRLLISWNYEGIEISPGNSFFYRINATGIRTSKEPVPLEFSADYKPNFITRLSARSRGEELPGNSLDLTLKFTEGRLYFFQDDREIFWVTLLSDKGILRIQGNEFPVTVDDIEIIDKDEESTSADFEPPFSLLIPSLFLVVVSAAIAGIYRMRPTWIPILRNSLYFSLLTFSSIWISDRYHFSNFQLQHFGAVISNELGSEILTHAEKVRHQFFSRFAKTQITHEALGEFYPLDQISMGPLYCTERRECNHIFEADFSQRGSPRLLLVGTSQSVGSGAETLNDTFFVKLHKKILVKKPKLISLNISLSGAFPQEMLTKYRSAVKDFKPDIILINLGHNGVLLDYQSAIPEMLALRGKAKTFLINEPSTNLIKEKIILSGYNETIAREYKVTVIPLLQNYLNYDGQKGNIWWDHVHFNNLGHELTAEYLFEKISPSL